MIRSVHRKLSAILSADVVGYSRLMGDDEVATLDALRAHRAALVEPKIAEHEGRVVKLMGDGMLAEFPSAVEAVSCAVAIQVLMRERNAAIPEGRRIAFRIGVNIGDVIIEGEDIYGDGVNVAARIEALADPGGICVARNVREQVRDKLDLNFEDRGEAEVKNISRPIRVFAVVLDEQAAAQVTAVVAVAGPGPRRRRAFVAAGLAIAFTAAGVTWWQPWAPETAPAPDRVAPAISDKPSIAVLPFDNLSNDPEQEYFADGLTDDLITDLSKISGLSVIARNTVFTYKDRAVDIRAVGRELGVRYVLEGSVRRAGDKLRINAQLIDSQTGDHLSAKRLDRDAADIFTAQDDIIGWIVEALAVPVSPSERQRLARLPTSNLEAYDFYLRAEAAAHTGFRPALRQALRLYDKATALDPSFAEAFAAQARTEAYVMRSNYDDVMALPLARKRAYEHASRALEIDSGAALPFSVLSELQTIDGRHEEALASARRAVAMGPSETAAHAALGLVLTFDGHHPEAIAEFETAMKLNPNLPIGTRLVASLSLMLDDQPERAVEILVAARKEAPNVDEVYAMLAAAYALVGRTDDARTAAAESARVGPNLSVELYRIKLGHFRRAEDLERILDAMTMGALQKWPFDFIPGARTRLTGAEIERLAIGHTLQGEVLGYGPGLTQIDADGGLAIRTASFIATGQAYVAGDTLCERAEAFLLGRPACGPVYLRADSAAEDTPPYTYVNANKVFHFSQIR